MKKSFLVLGFMALVGSLGGCTSTSGADRSTASVDSKNSDDTNFSYRPSHFDMHH